MNNKVMKIVGFATDITERVRAVNEIGGLAQLAENNLEHRLENPFIPAFERFVSTSIGRSRSCNRPWCGLPRAPM